MTTSTTERIKNLLVHIDDYSRVAFIAGVDPSYISQLMADEEFRDAVFALRLAQGEKHVKMDTTADSIELKLLEKLERALPMLVKPSEIVHALHKVNGLKRHVTNTASTHGAGGGTVVNIHLPPRAMMRFKVDSRNEVIEVEGQPLVAMPSANLLALAQEKGSAHAEVLDDLKSRITAYSSVEDADRATELIERDSR